MPTSGLGSTAARLALWRLAVIFHFHNLFQIDCGALWPEPMSPWSWARLLGSTVNRKNEKPSNRQRVAPPLIEISEIWWSLVIWWLGFCEPNIYGTLHVTTYVISGTRAMRAERRKRIVIFQEKHTMTFMSFSHRNLSAIWGIWQHSPDLAKKCEEPCPHFLYLSIFLKDTQYVATACHRIGKYVGLCRNRKTNACTCESALGSGCQVFFVMSPSVGVPCVLKHSSILLPQTNRQLHTGDKTSIPQLRAERMGSSNSHSSPSPKTLSYIGLQRKDFQCFQETFRCWTRHLELFVLVMATWAQWCTQGLLFSSTAPWQLRAPLRDSSVPCEVPDQRWPPLAPTCLRSTWSSSPPSTAIDSTTTAPPTGRANNG